MTRTIRLSAAVLGLVILLLLTGCPDMFTADLDSPMDPDADSYQGYDTTDNANDVQLHGNSGDGIIFLSPFVLSEVNGADRYGIQIATAASFAADAIVFEQHDFTANTIPVPLDFNVGTTYYWRGRAHTSAWGDYSARVSFSMANPWSGLSPADGETLADTTPSLSWDVVDGAATYEVQIAGSEAGVESATAVEVSEAEYTPASALTNNATHYWRVRAVDGDGQVTAWSGTNGLTVSWGSITGMSPADGATTTDTTPELSWDAVDGAERYELQITDNAGGVTDATPVTVNAPAHAYTWPTALTDGDELHWRVKAIAADDTAGAWSTVAMVTNRPSELGDTGPAGGIIFYDKGSYSNGWRYLEAAPSDQSSGIQWGGYGTSVGGTSTGIGSGAANTAAIVARLGTGSSYAARLCADLELGGYDDWFLPSKDELNQMYQQRGVIGGFASDKYWSSSEGSSSYAWGQDFGNGSQGYVYKYVNLRVRACRAF
jgi:hypothetical protein